MKVRKLTSMSLMIAVSIVLVTLLHFPIFPGAPFLEYDPADIPILLCALLFGPAQGLLATAAASIVQGVTVSAASGPYGIIMHIIATGTYVLVAGAANKRFGKKWKGNAVSLLLGGIAMAAVMIPANIIITPIFLGGTMENVMDILLSAIVPFNLLKAGINGAVTFVLYRALKKYTDRYFS